MATTTVGPGRTKTTWATYEADILGSSLSEDQTAQICADLNEEPDISGVTFNSYRVTLEGSNLDGNLRDATDPTRRVAGLCGFNFSTNGAYGLLQGRVTLKDLQFLSTGTYSVCVYLDSSTGNTTIIERCLFESGTNQALLVQIPAFTGTVRFDSCVFVQRNNISTGIDVGGSGGGVEFNNCTIACVHGTPHASYSDAIQSSYVTVTLYNTAVYGWTENKAGGGSVAGSHCSTDKASASGLPATSLQTSGTATDEFVAWNNSGTHDLTLKGSTSAKLKNLGTTGGSVPSFDFVNQSSSGSARDIGAWEYQEAASGKLLLQLQHHGAYL